MIVSEWDPPIGHDTSSASSDAQTERTIAVKTESVERTPTSSTSPLGSNTLCSLANRHNHDAKHQSSNQDGPPMDQSTPLPSGASNVTQCPGRKPAIVRRRGHCKSRLGCFNCKRRRVKCNEDRPICSPCKRLGLDCQYPTAANVSPVGAGVATPGRKISGTSNGTPVGGPNGGGGGDLAAIPQTISSPLSLEDLRFYHQFLKVAFPALPLKGEAVWSQFAAIAYNYEHLAHALLGLGASHLFQNCQVDCRSQALQHRVTAMKLVNEQLNALPTKTIDADALLASIICLVAQSSLMTDSMVEYVTMTRGANLVSVNIPHKENSLFGTGTTEAHIRLLRSMVTEQPKDLELIEDFRASVMLLQTLCREAHEVRYWRSLLSAVTALRTSGQDAWEEFVTLFLMPAFFTNQEFLSFLAPGNYTGRLLVIHMFLFDYMAGRFAFDPSLTPKTAGRKSVVISWTKKLAHELPEEYQPYIKWPLHFCDLLENYDARYLMSP